MKRVLPLFHAARTSFMRRVQRALLQKCGAFAASKRAFRASKPRYEQKGASDLNNHARHLERGVRER